ncbi:MAG: transketolase C-terminal domain-containing protein [Propioniciclava sp.]|uniref:transketolase family protein n=1 Tax=Propioniciclava sp. TaxID=2038686 RepID=UPI0039E6ACDB
MSEVVGLEMRKAYATVVADLFREHPDEIFALEADLSSAMATGGLGQVMGDHYVNVGIMEAHMVSAAAGINVSGGFAFVHSFGQFLARRALDQIFVSLAYAQLSACLVGSDAGVTAEHNGGTHMTFEDMGIVRVIPGVHVYEVCDPVQFAAVLRGAHARRGLTYVRTIRKLPARAIYPAGTDFGDAGARILRAGTDVSLLACGVEVAEALQAADLLAAQGISADVVDVFRIKPLDSGVILDSVRRTGAVVTAENHNVINGLGSAVAELLAEHQPTPLYRVGVRERFGQVGTTDWLMGDYGLTAADIAGAAARTIARANNVNAR